MMAEERLSRIESMTNEKGYVSRRAINKYRKVLGIENANKRKARNK